MFFRHNPTARRATVAATAALGVTTGLLLAGVGQADEPLKEGPAHMADFAWASQPQWNFHRGENCWPQSPFDADGNPTRPDDCVEAKDDGKDGMAFPTYYTAKKCNPDEVRVSYTIYQAKEKDGEDDAHDFEHIVVVWNKNGENWTRSQLLMSDDGKHTSKSWGEAESWNASGDDAGLGREFPRIWIQESTHGMHNDEDDDNRDHDYPVPASKNYDGEDKNNKREGTGLIRIEEGDELYNKFKDNGDGFADETMNPAVVADDLCEYSG